MASRLASGDLIVANSVDDALLHVHDQLWLASPLLIILSGVVTWFFRDGSVAWFESRVMSNIEFEQNQKLY